MSPRVLFIAANPSIDRTYEVDRLVAGEIHRPSVTVAVPGGKGLNAARAAATLGGSVTAVGIVGGRAGEWIVDRLAELAIDARMVRTAAETRTCISVVDRSTGDLTEIYERGAAIDAAAWSQFEMIVREEVGRADVVAMAVSGSLPPGAPGDGFGRLARIAAAGDAIPVLADTYGATLGAVLVERPAVIKVNAAEAGEASGIVVDDPSSAVRAAEVLRTAGAERVVVTLGLDGAVVVGGAERLHLVPPRDSPGAYSVGSGDAFLGGLAVAFARGEPVAAAARLGLAAAIANAHRAGAGNLNPDLANALFGGITSVAM
jgi:tagatose 6-phosphate kinase